MTTRKSPTSAPQPKPMPLPVRTFDPRESGLRRWFDTLEHMVMVIVWDLASPQNPITVGRVHQILRSRYGHQVAYTTTMTTMARLVAAGFLTREWGLGPNRAGAYSYTPRETKEQFVQRHKEIVAEALDNDDEESV